MQQYLLPVLLFIPLISIVVTELLYVLSTLLTSLKVITRFRYWPSVNNDDFGLIMIDSTISCSSSMGSSSSSNSTGSVSG